MGSMSLGGRGSIWQSGVEKRQIMSGFPRRPAEDFGGVVGRSGWVGFVSGDWVAVAVGGEGVGAN